MTGTAPGQAELAKSAVLALKHARSRIEALEGAASEPLAITGVSCRFPGGSNSPEEYWELLRSGTDAITEVPPDRWDIDRAYDADPAAPGKMITRWGGFLDQVDQFDPQFFGISPREAASMDPQQRLVLETGWEALERAGIAADKLAGTATGIFLGASTYDYSLLALKSPTALAQADLYRVTGSALNIIAGRLAYTLGLRGPCLVTDTACSSALTAVHLAAQSLRRRECDLALAGGVNLILAPELSVMFSKAHMLAPDGRCKTFDAAADGFARGEGCGIIVLRRLSDALADGDPILALARGTAINCDGRSSGLTAPNGQAQQAVIRAALANAHAAPHEIGFVETHGTGTALGDPIEVRALAAVLGEGRDNGDPVRLGAVKTNIGHLEAAAGIAGVIKAALALHHQQIPPSLHLHQPNPHIPWQELPVTVPTALEPWAGAPGSRLAGVSSFGFSGTNAHVILAEAPALAAPAAPAGGGRPVHLLCLSARSTAALSDLARRYQHRIEQDPSVVLADLAHTANTGRAHFPHRAALTAASAEEMRGMLASLAGSPGGADSVAGARTGRADPAGGPPVAFLFTGQGSQYPGMARELYESLPVFRGELRRCDELLRGLLDRPLLSVLYPEDGDRRPLDNTIYTQPALFAIEYALAQTWRSWGIEPSAVLGHSVGEYAAACVAGVLSLEDALTLIARRARLMGELPAGGAMAAVFTAEPDVSAAIAGYPSLAVAAVNGPANTVISGFAAEVDQVTAALGARGTRTERLTVSHAFHSPLMEPVLGPLEELAGAVTFAAPRIDLISNLTGKRLPSGSTLDARYVRRHARETVRFSDGIASLHDLGCRLFVEIGPHPVLLATGRRCLPDDGNSAWLPSLRKNHGDWQQLLDSLAGLYTHGCTADWAAVDHGVAGRRVVLPTYPFQRQRYWAAPQPVAFNEGSRQLTAGIPALQPAPAPDNDNVADWLYQVQWRPQPAAPGAEPQRLTGHWIILADRGDTGRSLARLLDERGATTELISAQSCDQHQDTPLAVPPGCRGVIHLWGLDAGAAGPDVTAASLRQDQARHCGGALRAVKALAATAPSPRLWIATRGAQPVRPGSEPVAIAQSPLWGLGRVLALEQPQLWGGLIDLDPRATGDPAGQDDAERLAEVICARLTAQGGEDQIAWRDGVRYVPRLTRDGQNAPGPAMPRADVTYAVTGGLGAAGSAVASWMARRGARHIALIGRTATPDAPAVAALARDGVQVLAIAADVADAGQAARALDQIKAAMPPLHGIVHAAGVVDDGLLPGQDWARFERVLSPKVAGAWNMHALTRDLPLDFFVLFSSAAALLGSPGQASYAAGNAFLDALAHWRRSQGLPGLAVDWGPWDIGMAARAGAAAQRRWARTGLRLLSCGQATQALGSLLAGAGQVAVLPADWTALGAALTADGVPAPSGLLSELAGAAAPRAAGAPSRPASGLSRYLALPGGQRTGFVRDHLRRSTAAVLGLADGDLPADTSLTGLGMDSLMAVEVAQSITRDFQLPLYPREVYEHPTLDGLAAYLNAELSAAHAERAPAATRRPAVSQPAGARPTVSRRTGSAPQRPGSGIVFLLSAPRSGSTLLRVMLAGHPGLFCPPELHLLPFHTLAEQRQQLGASYLHEGLQRALMELRGMDAAASGALLDSWTAEHRPVHEVYAELRRLAAPRLLVDKSPTYAASDATLRRAEELFPGARYLCLVRHPYAVIESFTRTRMHRLIGAGSDDPYLVAEQAWLRTNQNMLDFLRRIEPERQHLVRYEDLVSSPAEEAERICAFLGLPPDSAVLRPYDGERMTDGVHSQSLAIGDPNFLRHDKIEAGLADTWKTITLPHPLTQASRQAAADLGYPLPAPADSAPAENAPATPLASASDAMTAREQAVPVRGLQLSVSAWGPPEGPPVACLHGILDQGMAWEQVAVPLARDGYQVIAPDQRGHGRSSHAMAGGYRLLDYTADLDSLLTSLGTEAAPFARPVVLVGHSMGASVAAAFASLRPDRVGALVLVEGLMPGDPSDEEFTDTLETSLQYLTAPPAHAVLPSAEAAARRLHQAMPSLTQARARQLAERITRPQDDGVCWTWDPALLTRTDLSYDTLSFSQGRYRALLARIKAPVTLVYGSPDNPDLARMRAALPDAAVHVLPGGHNLHVDNPGALAHVIAHSAAAAGITTDAGGGRKP